MTPTPPETYAARRRRLRRALSGPAVLASGLARPRNFRANRYPFRAESHFLYFTGVSIERAVLLVDSEREVLYAPSPDPAEALWSGPEPGLDELGRAAAIEVRPIEELKIPDGSALVPPQDLESAAWLEEYVSRPVDASGGPELEGSDQALADAIIGVRLLHDAAAVAQLREAAEATVAAHRAGMRATRPGIREWAVRAAMEAEIVGRGMTTSYNSIVTVHGEVLHNERYDGLLEASDLLLADVGAESREGWAGDVTRTWPVAGRFSPTQRALYEVVLSAQKKAIELVKPGVRYRDVHRAAGREILAGLIALGIYAGDLDELYEKGAAALFFPHGIGHLLGLDVHDMEDLGDRAGYAPGRTRAVSRGDRYLRLDRDLEPGMCVTIEPGLYLIPAMLDDPGEVGELEPMLNRAELAKFADVRGIRIEDDVLVTESGHDVLTGATPKSVAEVEAAVGR
jgi:Xaa-Pro aminopeptidase